MRKHLRNVRRDKRMDNINLYVDLVGPKYKKRSKFSRMIRRLLRKVMK